MARRNYRRNRGSVAALAFIALLPLVGAIGGFAVDCMHVNDEKGGLQRATDAAALAGAMDIPMYQASLVSTNTVQAAGNNQGINDALVVAKLNKVDGRPVVTTAAGDCWVQAQFPGAPGTPPTTCQVDGRMNIRSLFSMLFGNWGQTVTTHSVAGISKPIDTVVPNGVYPMTFGFYDAQPAGGPSLSTLAPGATYTWTFNPSGPRNSLWTDVTSHDAADVHSAQTAYGQGINNPGWVPGASGGTPPVQLGTNLDCSNGTQASSEHNLAALNSGDVLVCPVVSSVAGGGGSYPVIGFVEIAYTSVTGPWGNAIFTGKIVKGIAPGISQNLTSSDSTAETYKNTNGPITVKLIQ